MKTKEQLSKLSPIRIGAMLMVIVGPVVAWTSWTKVPKQTPYHEFAYRLFQAVDHDDAKTLLAMDSPKEVALLNLNEETMRNLLSWYKAKVKFVRGAPAIGLSAEDKDHPSYGVSACRLDRSGSNDSYPIFELTPSDSQGVKTSVVAALEAAVINNVCQDADNANRAIHRADVTDQVKPELDRMGISGYESDNQLVTWDWNSRRERALATQIRRANNLENSRKNSH